MPSPNEYTLPSADDVVAIYADTLGYSEGAARDVLRSLAV
jgi:hypothetical protein